MREHAQLFGRTQHYTIYDQGDMRRVLDWILADKERAAVHAALGRCGQPASSEVQSALSLAKNELLSPEAIRSRARYEAAELIAVLWTDSEEELRRSNVWDFDDLLAFGPSLRPPIASSSTEARMTHDETPSGRPVLEPSTAVVAGPTRTLQVRRFLPDLRREAEDGC